MSAETVVTRPVDPSRWSDFKALMEARGAPHFCWCMAWRPKPPGTGSLRGAARKQVLKSAMRAMVDAGTPVGILGYCGGEPVAWCSIAPREGYRRLGGPAAAGGAVVGDTAAGGTRGTVWAIACFFIRRERRGQGLMAAMLAGAIDEARRQGATTIEAYPVDRDAPSYRFMGFRDVFQAAGFVEAGRAGHGRHVMRLSLARSETAEGRVV